MKTSKTPIIITTINKPTKAVQKLAKLDKFMLFIAGDNKTPKNWDLKNSHFISISDQRFRYPKLASLVAENHYARKNFAYLEAIKTGANYLYETDDDNLPYPNFHNFLENKTKLKVINSGIIHNIYEDFSKKKIWPRGFLLSRLLSATKPRFKRLNVIPIIQQSLADLDPDVDAIYRLTLGSLVKFQRNKKLALAAHTYCPFNSQNTYWHKDAYALLYLPSTVNSRVCDIWRGYIAQRILWEMKSKLIFTSPCVYQERNSHNLMKDFFDEIDLYLKTEKLIEVLENINLYGDPSQMLIIIYKVLVKEAFFLMKEFKTLEIWLKELQKIQN
jgi:hypothetical protein